MDCPERHNTLMSAARSASLKWYAMLVLCLQFAVQTNNILIRLRWAKRAFKSRHQTKDRAPLPINANLKQD